MYVLLCNLPVKLEESKRRKKKILNGLFEFWGIYLSIAKHKYLKLLALFMGIFYLN